MRPAFIAVVAIVMASCSDSNALLTDPEGRMRFSALEQVEPMVEGTRVKWELSNHVTVTMQRVPVSDALVRERTAEAVVEALVERVTLGEVDGELVQAVCSPGRVPASCLSGRTRIDQRVFVRRGMVVRAGDDLVLLEAIGPEGVEPLVAEQARLMEQSLILL